jgi:hypothetical protein
VLGPVFPDHIDKPTVQQLSVQPQTELEDCHPA